MPAEDPHDSDPPTPPGFFSVWGVPLALGGLAGFMVMARSASGLADQFGGPLGAAATCALGFVVALAVIAGCRAVARIVFGK